MIQVRDEIECGETADVNGVRWKLYGPGPVRVQTFTPPIIAAMILGAIVSAVNWYGVIVWLSA